MPFINSNNLSSNSVGKLARRELVKFTSNTVLGNNDAICAMRIFSSDVLSWFVARSNKKSSSFGDSGTISTPYSGNLATFFAGKTPPLLK